MPPHSRGLVICHLLRRLASTSTSINHPQKPLFNLPRQIPNMPPRKPKSEAKQLSPEHSTSTEHPSPPPDTTSLPRVRGIGARLIPRFGPTARKTFRIVYLVLLTSPIIIVIKEHFPYDIMPVTGLSMSPFLNGDHQPDLPNTDDHVLVDRRYPNWVGTRGVGNMTLKRGMIVVFPSPLNPERIALKRVVALEGDIVYPKHPYPGAKENKGVLVPFGHVWVEGDIGDTERSLDSNTYGPISQNLVMGMVSRVIWPIKHFSTVKWEDWKGIGDRLQENAANLADPDEVKFSEKFLDGTAGKMLGYLRLNGQRERLMQTEAGRKELAKIFRWAEAEAQRRNPATMSLAEEILAELRHGREIKEATEPPD